mmetsp:Transcript_27931/g.37751  ORF Transcript_27931/g.37751 Transcript_27931/m.37751 type:complete len:164 (-) Transcript_27931:78-569(-)
MSVCCWTRSGGAWWALVVARARVQVCLQCAVVYLPAWLYAFLYAGQWAVQERIPLRQYAGPDGGHFLAHPGTVGHDVFVAVFFAQGCCQYACGAAGRALDGLGRKAVAAFGFFEYWYGNLWAAALASRAQRHRALVDEFMEAVIWCDGLLVEAGAKFVAFCSG